jgi:general secretion pathway protein L
MTAISQITTLLSRWIDAVAVFLVGILGRFSSSNSIELIEDADGTFALKSRNAPAGGEPFERVRIVDGRLTGAHPESAQRMLRGSRADVVLRPSHFVFRPLELPQRAAEFLGGVVRAQIDRLTPWNAADAAFGWSNPVQADADRISVTVAATARALLLPYVQALTAAGAQSVIVSTPLPDASAAGVPIRVLEQSAGGMRGEQRLRRLVVAVLAVAALAAAASLVASTVVTANLGARQDELARRIAERRAAIRNGRDRGELAATPLRTLERRKYESPATVIVLDALSQILPDHTYVIELRIEGDKLRLSGITRDAPGLIRLMEQNPLFSRATFFAPTTRAPSDPGDRFHIEAHIEPMQAPRS